MGEGAEDFESALLDRLTEKQREAVRSDRRRVLVVAGAGSGKTDVMARRIAWWTSSLGVARESIVAFTFTEKAAEEMQFRVRSRLGSVQDADTDSTLGGMYVGTIHGFCLQLLREFEPDTYHNFDVIDEGGSFGFIERGYWNVLGLEGFKHALEGEGEKIGHFAAIRKFATGYALLQEFDEFDVELSDSPMPNRPGPDERDWCEGARLLTDVGDSPVAEAFATSAARYYAFMRCRRFFDFATSQSEAVRLLRDNGLILDAVRERFTHLVVDEVQDVNPVQAELVRLLVGDRGNLTAVGDHRQAIFGWRGGRVEIMADLYRDLEESDDGQIVELEHNFRSTPRLIEIANQWSNTITPLGTMPNPAMTHGRESRVDYDASHTVVLGCEDRPAEAAWIAETIGEMVNGEAGARHDTLDGRDRGLGYEDIAILLRSGTSSRDYMHALEQAGIPAIFKGSDLFSQPEVLAVVGAMSMAAGVDSFYGGGFGKSLPAAISEVLGCDAEPGPVIRAACEVLRGAGLPLDEDAEHRVVTLAGLFARRLSDDPVTAADCTGLRSSKAPGLVVGTEKPRRVFPQAVYHTILEELGVSAWDGLSPRGSTAMYHLGALSSLITGMETPGWTTPFDFRAQMIALTQWGPQSARIQEADLMVQPRAVTISTVHAAKGLEFGAVFLADVQPQRFPSSMAKRKPNLPFDGEILNRIDPAQIADNDNRDGERRLMYVAITRAERYLFVSCSGPKRGEYVKWLRDSLPACGGIATDSPETAPQNIELAPWRPTDGRRLVSSFSDLRYYLECPHDFYLRKVLGFAPTIDQAFGYGRGVHNIMRAIHSDPSRWAALAADPARLDEALSALVDDGLFYLRYTVGDPLERMQRKALEITAEYVRRYADELGDLEFEPEREFQTLIEEEEVLISGAIDVIRRDAPPQVTLVDFKSGEAESDLSMKLDSEEMKLQISLYGLAAKTELEYEPELGLVRYLGEQDKERRELEVPLTEEALSGARSTVVDTARRIKNREFEKGPSKGPRDSGKSSRCEECDFEQFCGIRAQMDAK